ncbi:hypothetical protein [Streptomyces sp. NPDC091371]|uniref:hypothetical protein n=1 Tax=Streptomyces sp. NPDC091371 TaxID=3155303 RepID=UPI00344460C7
MPDSYEHDPLRSLFREAASAGQSRAVIAPVSVIAVRGERARRRRIAGFALACCLVLAGSGAAVAALLPGDPGPALPASTPPPTPQAPSPAPTESRTRPASPPATPRSTTSPPPSATATATTRSGSTQFPP